MSMRRLVVLLRGLGFRMAEPEVLHDRGLEALDEVPELAARDIDQLNKPDPGPQERDGLSSRDDIRSFFGGQIRVTD
jgi:hypothetical protein